MRNIFLKSLLTLLVGSMIFCGCAGCGSVSGGSENSDGNSETYDSIENLADFIVEVDEKKDPIVLQITDTQIIDAAQIHPGRSGVDKDFWATDKVNERCYDYLTELIRSVNPDLILLTGDIVYGEFDDSGSALFSFIEFMESFGVPWAPVFGNHDNESKKGADWQCEQLEKAEHCLFKQRRLTGNGNYSVGIKQGNELKRVFYMLDSNGCAAASEESLANGHTKSSIGFGLDQVKWFTEEINKAKSVAPDLKISFAFHIQLSVFGEALKKYGFNADAINQGENAEGIFIDYEANRTEGDFGFIGRKLKDPWATINHNVDVWKIIKGLDADSVFVGHEHCNSASVLYEGVRLQYGQKSSEYDRFNSLNENGTITGGYSKSGISLIGGTVMTLSKTDGAIADSRIQYCKNAGADVDWNGIFCN